MTDNHADDSRIIVELLARSYAELAVNVADVDMHGVRRAFEVSGDAMLS